MLCHGIYISHAISSSIELIWFLESDFILMMLFELCPPSVTWSCHRVKTFTVSALWYYPRKSLNGWYREWMCYRRYIFDVVNQSGFFFFKSWHSSTRLVLFHLSLIRSESVCFGTPNSFWALQRLIPALTASIAFSISESLHFW